MVIQGSPTNQKKNSRKRPDFVRQEAGDIKTCNKLENQGKDTR
jgi:hypothetical protein